MNALLQAMTGCCDNTRRSLFVKRISFLTPDALRFTYDASRDVSSKRFRDKPALKSVG